MSDHPDLYRPFSADGHTARWQSLRAADTAADTAVGERDATETAEAVDDVTLSWDNEAWTASGLVGREQVQYVLRISPTWQVRQFLLFRDMDEPDLWVGTDGGGRWGEMNGAHRPELDGCVDIELACTPFTHTLPVRRLPLHVGHAADIVVAVVDVETLDIQAAQRRYTRLDTHHWRVEDTANATVVEFDVDEFGLAGDYSTLFRRLA
ncbi:unannotated protein [freshwater metagenome]|uniref:Unannotated protein n=1 Tax=freshwater metagenome TaxID=449393 RepID=A0A6J7DKC3_9ZZZZ|nr:hypothetical protein [Actinomycetota bacterium]